MFNAISRVKDIGTKLLKEGKLNKAYEKYAKAAGFATDYFPEELSEADVSELNKLKISCSLNLALVALKLKEGKNAIKAANEALEIDTIDDKSKAKALYRKGLGYLLAKDEESAQKCFEEALKLEPTDAAIQKGLQDVKAQIKARKEKQKRAMSKFFK